MLTRERVATITRLAFPVSIALSSTLLMSLVDLAMVGRLGNHATAAVGLSVFGNTLVLAFVMGIAPAVQGLVARRRGEGSSEARCLPLNAGLLTAVIIGTPLAVICSWLTPSFFALVSSDPEVTKIGVPFLRVLYIGIVAAGMNAAFRGHWAGMERPNVHMLVVLFMNCLNILLNYMLIFGKFGAPALGAPGAAVATVIALYAGAVVNGVLSHVVFRNDGFLSVKPDKGVVARVFRMGMPATMQEFTFSAGYIVFYWLVGQVGTAELAAANVQVRVSMVLLILASALGMASATLVSRSLGEGDPAGAAEWGWDSGKLGVISITLLGLPLVLFPRFFLSIFLSDPRTIDVAVIPFQLTAGTAGLGSLIWIFAYTLYSVGDGNRVMMISFGTQWLLFLPAVWIVGPYLKYGLLQISLVQLIYGILATTLITAAWADGRWKKVKV